MQAQVRKLSCSSPCVDGRDPHPKAPGDFGGREKVLFNLSRKLHRHSYQNALPSPFISL